MNLLHRTYFLRLATVLLVLVSQSILALSPPGGFDIGRRSVQISGNGSGWNGLVLVGGHPHVIEGSSQSDLNYTWFDGFSWQGLRISQDRVLGPVSIRRVGNTLHFAVNLKDRAGGNPRLTYFAVEAGTGTVLRRLDLGEAQRYALALSTNQQSVRIVLQRPGGIAQLLNVDSVQLSPIPLLANGRLRGAVTDQLGSLWIAYDIPGPSSVQVRAMQVGSSSFSDELVGTAVSTAGSDFEARIAITANNTPLLAYIADIQSERSQTHQWRRRTGPGQWSCPLSATDCELTQRQNGTVSEAIFRDFAIADDTGGSYVAILTRRLGFGPTRVSIRRVYLLNNQDGPIRDNFFSTQAADPARRVVLQIASAPPTLETTTFSDSSGLQVGLPEGMPWRNFSTSLPLDSALAQAVNPRGEAVVIGMGGMGVGLRQSFWNAGAQGLTMSPMRPASERYTSAAMDFARDGTLHALAIDPNAGVVHLERADLTVTATRSVLSSLPPLAIAFATPQIAVDRDGALLASWQDRPDGQIRLARRANGSTSWEIDSLPGNHPGAARPQLALTQTGLVLVSAYDVSSQRIRVWQRESEVATGPFELRMETPAVVSQGAHDLAGIRDGRFALAYVSDEGGLRQVAYRYLTGGNAERTLSHILPAFIPGNEAVSSVRLALVDDLPSDARIVYAHGQSAWYARRTTDQLSVSFEVKSLGFAASVDQAAGIELSVNGTASYMAARTLGQLQVLQHDHNESFGTRIMSRLGVIANRFNWVQPDLCQCFFSPCSLPSNSRLLRFPLVGGGDLAPLLRQRFTENANSRRYLQLFYDHGVEMAALTIADPFFAAERISVFSQFVPGLRAFVEGKGSDLTMTPEMLERAAGVWDYWAEHGSPALQAAIAVELAQTNRLQIFADMSFDQWFNALPSEPPMFKDGFERVTAP